MFVQGGGPVQEEVEEDAEVEEEDAGKIVRVVAKDWRRGSWLIP